MPDQREMYRNEAEVLRLAVQAALSRVWTALPGIINSFDATNMKATVQPAVNGTVRTLVNGQLVYQSVQLPMLPHVPVYFPSGGGMTLTFPIAAGDECLLVFSARCIDAWWSQGGVQDPSDPRRHHFSDAFALVGLRSQPNVLDPPMSTSAVELRSDDDSFYLQMNPTTKAAKLIASGGIDLNGVTIDSSGNVVAPGTVKGQDLLTVSDSLSSIAGHTHTYTPGSGAPTQTSAPVSGT